MTREKKKRKDPFAVSLWFFENWKLFELQTSKQEKPDKIGVEIAELELK